MKRPSFQFYPSDWLRDTALRSCSAGARGLWIDMICFMHEGNPYGYLKVGDKVILADNLHRMVGETLEVVERWLDELSTAGVYDIENGVICSRRMIRDEELRQKRAEGGKLGGNPALKIKDKVNLKVERVVKQIPTPSSSSSSSSSNKEDKATDVALLPDWIPLETWVAFLEMRKKIKKPPTEHAINLLIAKLDKFRQQGQDIQAVLEKSITSSWQDVFEIKENKTFAQQAADIARTTVPAKQGPDPALLKIEQDRQKAVPMPANIREQINSVLRKV